MRMVMAWGPFPESVNIYIKCPVSCVPKLDVVVVAVVRCWRLLFFMLKWGSHDRAAEGQLELT